MITVATQLLAMHSRIVKRRFSIPCLENSNEKIRSAARKITQSDGNLVLDAGMIGFQPASDWLGSYIKSMLCELAVCYEERKPRRGEKKSKPWNHVTEKNTYRSEFQR